MTRFRSVGLAQRNGLAINRLLNRPLFGRDELIEELVDLTLSGLEELIGDKAALLLLSSAESIEPKYAGFNIGTNTGV